MVVELVERARAMNAATEAEEEVIKQAAAVAYAGGADTVRIVLRRCI